MKGHLTQSKLIIRVAIGLLLLAIVLLICASIGSKDISLAKALSDSLDKEIFFRIRLPRVFMASIVGAALACSGVVLQGLLRNPLADPYILGISSGAGLGAIIATVTATHIHFLGKGPIAIFAFAGALGTVWLVWLIGSLSGGKNTTTLLLAGVVVNSFFSSVIMFLVSIAKSQNLQATTVWLMGNIAEEETNVIIAFAITLCISLGVLFSIAPKLNLLSFGQSDAESIGIESGKVRIIAFSTAALITAIAVSLSGLIGFAGLIVPHAVRLTFGPDHRQLLPLSAIFGAIFLVVTDTFARTIIAPAQLSVGIVTAIIGGPFFLVLLLKYSQRISLTGK